MELKFTKMQGLGNDFVVIENFNKQYDIIPELAKKIADRKFGIGCDQLVILEKSANSIADAKMIIINQDGSHSLACGNALRCVGLFLNKQPEFAGRTNFNIINEANEISEVVLKPDNNCLTIIPEPKFEPKQIPVICKDDKPYISFEDFPNLPNGYFVNVGNPHIVFFVDDLTSLNIEYYGKLIESNTEIFPERVNVNFAQKIDYKTIKLITYERGCGVTLACGTGASATSICAIKYFGLSQSILVEMKSGNLAVEWNGSKISLCGNADLVYSGHFYY